MLGTKTQTYQKIVAAANIFNNLPNQLVTVNLGSSSASSAFDYQIMGIHGANLALCPQTLYYDYQILQQYISHIKLNGIICVPICFFTFLVEKYNADSSNLKYYNFLEYSRIINYTPTKKFLWNHCPVFLMPSLLKECLVAGVAETLNVTVSKEEDKKWADKWWNGWRKEFGWNNNTELSETQKVNADRVFNILLHIFQYCHEFDRTPVLIIPPVSSNLMAFFPEKLLNECFWKYVNRLRQKGEWVIDLSKNDELSDYSNYCNALIFNDKGRVAFSKKMKDLLFS